MGDINSKNCIDALQGSSLIKSSQSQGSSKNNIVVVNPEIHLHSSNENATSGSVTNDRRIKELEAELKLKQDEIELERGIRQLEERERNAERVRVNRLLSERENEIHDRNDLINWHTDVLKEKRPCLGEAYPASRYGQSEKRIRMEHGTTGGFQQANKKRKKKKNKWPHHVNQSFTNNYTHRNAPSYHSQRTRSKTEINFENDPMELWEWNGTKWVRANGSEQNAEQVSDPKSSKSNSGPQKQSSIEANVPSTSKTHDAGSSKSKLQPVTPSTSKVPDNGESESNTQLPDKVCEGSAVEASKIVHCLDETVNRAASVTNLRHQRVVVTEVSLPSNFSISFDEREITRFMNHDETLFTSPKRTRKPK